jgi:site-specific DNA-methyltransferase (adenine-specific)
MTSLPPNTLYYGDNLDILRAHIADASVDLVYLDPPFNSNRTFNVLFRDEAGRLSDAQIAAFDDTWQWGDAAEHTYRDLVATAPPQVSAMVGAMHQMLGRSPMMAYLVMMAVRLVELHRALKPTGSLYLHCDPTASHYLKILLDAIFGPERFLNEIIWLRHNARSTSGRWPRLHDTLLGYSKSDQYTFTPVQVAGDATKIPHTLIIGADGQKYQTYELTAPGVTLEGVSGRPWRTFSPGAMGRHWANTHETMDAWDTAGLIHWPKGGGFPRRRAPEPFCAESRRVTVGDVWTDIDRINQTAKERLGYPTQKPLALLERIIAASSNPGDTILDPFCGCGTAIAASQRLDRRWIGIDITHLAISIQKSRLADMFPGIAYQVLGEPEDLGAAHALAQQDRYQFQWWALSLVQARPLGEAADGRRGKKGADRGIDGVITFVDEAAARPKRALVQVKSGHVTPRDVRDLRGVIEREQAALGAFITLEEPSREMRAEATSAGYYRSPGWGRDFPRLQILSVGELLRRETRLEMPPIHGPFKRAERSGGGTDQAGFGW